MRISDWSSDVCSSDPIVPRSWRSAAVGVKLSTAFTRISPFDSGSVDAAARPLARVEIAVHHLLDLDPGDAEVAELQVAQRPHHSGGAPAVAPDREGGPAVTGQEIGRASCRERVCEDVEDTGVAEYLK